MVDPRNAAHGTMGLPPQRAMNSPLDLLRALDASDRNGSFAGAAKELHRVPSAVTYLVQNLESALGVTLFERSKRKAALTDAGRRVLAEARDVIDRAKNLEALASHLAGGWEATLHIAVDGALPMAPVSKCIASLSEAGIPTTLRVDIEYQEGVLDRIERDGADIGLYLGFDADEEARPYETVAMPALRFVRVSAPGQVGRASSELVVRDSAQRFHDDPKRPYDDARNIIFLSDFHSKRIALLEGAGSGWVPEHLVQHDLASGALVLGNEDCEWTYNPVIVWPTGRPLGRAGARFLELLAEHVGS